MVECKWCKLKIKDGEEEVFGCGSVYCALLYLDERVKKLEEKEMIKYGNGDRA